MVLFNINIESVLTNNEYNYRNKATFQVKKNVGFYKKDTDTILTGENFVFSPIVTLTKETKDDYTYPQDGWYWFDTFDEALRFFAGLKSSDSITPRQARLILLDEGLLDNV